MPYHWVDHTSEVELSIEADSPEIVFKEAAEALGKLLDEEGRGPEQRRRIRVTSTDLPGLLVEWLNELVFLAEDEGLIPETAGDVKLAEDRLEAVVAGHRSEPQNLVKGVTYHRLEMAPADGTWIARVVLDV